MHLDDAWKELENDDEKGVGRGETDTTTHFTHFLKQIDLYQGSCLSANMKELLAAS